MKRKKLAYLFSIARKQFLFVQGPYFTSFTTIFSRQHVFSHVKRVGIRETDASQKQVVAHIL